MNFGLNFVFKLELNAEGHSERLGETLQKWGLDSGAGCWLMVHGVLLCSAFTALLLSTCAPEQHAVRTGLSKLPSLGPASIKDAHFLPDECCQ